MLLEIRDVLVNDRFGGGQLLPAKLMRYAGNFLQGINVIEINAVELVHFRGHVPRYSNIVDKKRTIGPVAQNRNNQWRSQEMCLSRSRRIQNIDFATLPEPSSKGHCDSFQPACD